ncbi:MAG: hypothetical protein HKN22_01910, partial [Bacteroidia bacterium]|nr:hypothetical protein [Bacteroidia bacterium]
RFEGFQIYQLASDLVTINEQSIADPDQIRLLAQVDLDNNIGKIVNYNFNPDLGITIPVIAVDGEDKGLRHTFEITQDLFALGDPKLINHKTYYYSVVSYAYNNFKTFDPNDPSALDGQKKPYLQGRNNVNTYAAIPHKPATESGGQILGSKYGDGMEILKIEGGGNGGRVLDFNEGSREALLANDDHMVEQPTYIANKGPVNVKVYDPTLVEGKFHELKYDGIADESYWSMSDLTTSPQTVVDGDKPIGADNEQIMKGDEPNHSWGVSVNMKTVGEILDGEVDNNGFLEATINFSDNTARWLTGVTDIDGNDPRNWIRSGTNASVPVDYIGFDDAEVYENVINGTWAPYKLGSKEQHGPKWSGIAEAQVDMDFLNSVDVIITADRSKWSRAAVIETSPVLALNQKFGLRTAASVDKNGSTTVGPDNNDFPTGMSWFPGYAYNVETGERLNIAFGENSFLGDPEENAQDMMWNPSSTILSSSGEPYFGGGHYIYIFDHNGDNPTKDVPRYDECNFIHQALSSGNNTAKRDVWKDCAWMTLPVLVSGKELLSSEVHIRLRISKPYIRQINRANVWNAGDNLDPNSEYYVAEGSLVYNGTTYGRTPGTGSFDISGSAGNEFTINVNGIPISRSIISSDDDSITANRVARSINAKQTDPEYTAIANVNSITITAEIGTGASVNGHVISDIISTGGAATMIGNIVNINGAEEIKFTTDASGGTFTGTALAVTPAPRNDFNPLYSFGTGDLAVITGSSAAAKEAMAEVRAVPNPYYAFSAYEDDQLDNTIKITNLPAKCKIRIYTTNGTMIKEINRAVASNNSLGALNGFESDTSVDWDLKNQKGIPIASGVYLIHIDAPGIGEKVLKWFGVLRPVDLDSF